MSRDSSNSDSADSQDDGFDLSVPVVVTKYNGAADITNQALKVVIGKCVAGARIVSICEAGDKYITDACSKVYNKGKVEKGIAFPTCISVNNVAGHFSPLGDDTTVLNTGDLVKIDLGCHLDGFATMVAHTIVVKSDERAGEAEVIKGRKADVLSACYAAANAALRLIKPGKKNREVTDMWGKCAEAFKCKPLEGVLSHELKRFSVDEENCIISKVDLSKEIEVKEIEFEPNKVFSVDIVMSTGEGSVREMEQDTTVFKRDPETKYSLKMKHARALYSQINQKFPHFPFTTRALAFDTKARLGITEIRKRDLLQEYPVLYEHEGEFVAQVKFTVLLMPSGTRKVTGFPYDLAADNIQSEHKIEDEELLALLKTSVKNKKKKRGGKKKKKPAPALNGDGK